MCKHVAKKNAIEAFTSSNHKDSSHSFAIQPATMSTRARNTKTGYKNAIRIEVYLCTFVSRTIKANCIQIISKLNFFVSFLSSL